MKDTNEPGAWNATWHRPVRFIPKGDKEVAYRNSPNGQRLLFQLKNLQNQGFPGNSVTKTLPDGTIIRVHTKVAGMDIVEVNGKRGAPIPKTRVTKHLAPAFELFSWISGDGGKHYANEYPELIAVMPDFKSFAYIYEPEILDELDPNISEVFGITGAAYDPAFNETYYAKRHYVSTETTLGSPDRKVEIKELFDVTNQFDRDFMSASFSHSHTRDPESADWPTHCPQDPTFLLTETSSISYNILYYGDILKDGALNATATAKIGFMGAPSVGCPYGEFIIGYTRSDYKYSCGGASYWLTGNYKVYPYSSEHHKSKFSDERDMYYYSYYDFQENFVDTSGLPWSLTAYDQLQAYAYEIHTRSSRFILHTESARTGATYDYDLPIGFHENQSVLDTHRSEVGELYVNFYDYEGEPVCVLVNQPHKYKQINGNFYLVTDDPEFEKIWHYIFYKGKITKSPIGFSRIGSTDFPYLLTDINEKPVTIMNNGKTYYASGRVRMVEVTETVTEY